MADLLQSKCVISIMCHQVSATLNLIFSRLEVPIQT